MLRLTATVLFFAALVGFFVMQATDVLAVKILGGVLLVVGATGEFIVSIAAAWRRWSRPV